MTEFQFAAASVVGRDHREAGRNNEDSFLVSSGDKSHIALIADGCGSSPHSEVGAKLGLKILANVFLGNLGYLDVESPASFFAISRHAALFRLEQVVRGMQGAFGENLWDYFLFTVVGVIIADDRAVFFSLGDGTMIVNGENIPIGPFPNNEPPYLTYGLRKTSLSSKAPHLLNFQVHRNLRVEELKNFLIGSDGIGDLIRARDLLIPGKEEVVGSIDQFWSNDRYFKNPDALRRRLFLVNRDTQVINWETRQADHNNGHLPDDTTMVVGRQRS